MNCAVMGCGAKATHLVTWKDEDGDEIPEEVCEEDGQAFIRRPRLHATLTPLEDA